MKWKLIILSCLATANVFAVGGLAVCVSVLRSERDDAILQRDTARKQSREALAYIAELQSSIVTLPAHSSGTLIIGDDGKPHVEIDKPGDRWNIGPNGLPQLESVIKKPKEDRVQ